MFSIVLGGVKNRRDRFCNGEYSGQNPLFMPQPPEFQIPIFALFSAAFFGAVLCRLGVGR